MYSLSVSLAFASHVDAVHDEDSTGHTTQDTEASQCVVYTVQCKDMSCTTTASRFRREGKGDSGAHNTHNNI